MFVYKISKILEDILKPAFILIKLLIFIISFKDCIIFNIIGDIIIMLNPKIIALYLL
jgi:hypothetical protein